MEPTQNTLMFIARNLYILSNIPITEISTEGETLTCLMPPTYSFPSFLNNQLKDMAFRIGRQKALLEDYQELPLCLCLYKSNTNRLFVFGPVLYHTPSTAQQRTLQKLLQKEQKSQPIVKISYAKLLAAITDFAYTLDGYVLTPPELHSFDMIQLHSDTATKEIVRYMIEQETDLNNNHSIAEEQYTLELLRNGNVEKMQDCMLTFNISYPQVLSGNALKTDEYMAVAAIGIMARTAIEGGITSSESFRLSDILLKRVSQCKTRKEILSVRNAAFIEFTRLVHNHSHHSESSNSIEDCKKYIAANIRKKISLADVAQNIGIEKTYLARLFSASEGITVGQYIRREKIQLAKNMLSYSDRSITEIAYYLGFDSHSYFGKLFLAETGLTPNQYRLQHHSAEY